VTTRSAPVRWLAAGRLGRVAVGDVMQAGPAADGAAGPADLFFADPPYNFGLDYGGGAARDRLPDDAYLAWLGDWLALGVSRVRPGGAVCVLLPDEWAAEAAFIMRWRLKLDRRNWVKWHETFGVQTKAKFARCSRHLLYFVRPGGEGWPVTFNADAVKVPSARQTKYGDKRAAAGGKVPGDVWEFSRVCGTFGERVKAGPGVSPAAVPTQLPEALLARVVAALTRPGDRVLEYFAGTGSLGRAAVRTGRLYEGWESNPATAALAAARVAEAGAARGT